MQTSLPQKIAIIDYSMGNLFSLKNACEKIGHDAIITNNKEEIHAADIIFLPGVGAFADAMKNIKKLDLDKVIIEEARKGKPLLGICLGMQLLLSESHEFGVTEGLNLIKGKVLPLPKKTSDGNLIRIPHLGWSKAFKVKKNINSALLESFPDETFQYFAHSFYADVENQDEVLINSTYSGFPYASAIRKENIVGFQFHPEKSSFDGLQLLSTTINYLALMKTEWSHKNDTSQEYTK